MPDHLGIETTDSHVAILTGNPDRAPLIAARFENHELLTDRRGYLCYQAIFHNRPLLVVSTGIGAPSTAIVVEELIDLGVTTLIRLGTCGALQPEVHVGDLVISTACIREEGTSRQYVDVAFPAIPDHMLLHELVESARQTQTMCHVGITHCKDAYYSERPDKQLVPEYVQQRWQVWRNAGVLATEMESSALFVLGQLRHIRTSALFVNVGKNTDQILFENSLNAAVLIIQHTLQRLIDKNLISVPEARKSTYGKSFLENPAP